jgi:glycerophosphoryl diester phosphodiesterase
VKLSHLNAGIAGLMMTSLFAVAAQAADPIVIAHRGASGYLPEHTLAAYELAVQMGADYIEPDLQFTSDGVLVAVHDDTLNRTTNVAALFAPRNGGYQVKDFTLAEIKTLTAIPPAGGTAQNSYPGFTPTSSEMRVPTFQEVIDLAKQQSLIAGREIGIYPEAKQADPAMEDAILNTLAINGYGNPGDQLFVQSFSDTTVRSLDIKSGALGLDIPLVLLGAAITTGGVGNVAVLGAGGSFTLIPLSEVATFADGIGMVINYPIAPITADFIAQAHAVGLEVHGWTFGKSNPALAADEFQYYLDLGMDGVFANYPDLAVDAVSAFSAPVPEPESWAMMVAGFAGMGLILRRRRAIALQTA